MTITSAFFASEGGKKSNLMPVMGGFSGSENTG